MYTRTLIATAALGLAAILAVPVAASAQESDNHYWGGYPPPPPGPWPNPGWNPPPPSPYVPGPYPRWNPPPPGPAPCYGSVQFNGEGGSVIVSGGGWGCQPTPRYRPRPWPHPQPWPQPYYPWPGRLERPQG